MAGDGPGLALSREASARLRGLREAGSLPRVCEFGMDKTAIPRHGGRPGEALVRGRPRGGTWYGEAHMAAQCAARGAGIVVAAARFLPHHTVGGQVSIIGSRVPGACEEAGISTVLLMDRGLFSTSTIGWLGGSGARWPAPCPNTLRVVGALREFAAGKRPRVSTAWICDAYGREARHTMIIVKRRKRRRRGRGGNAEDRYVAFAASDPGIDVETYARRWGIETGHGMAKRARIRTPGRNEAVRALCLVMSLAAHNAWVMACAGLRRPRRDGWLSQALYRLALVAGAIGALGLGPEPEPPPPVLP